MFSWCNRSESVDVVEPSNIQTIVLKATKPKFNFNLSEQEVKIVEQVIPEHERCIPEIIKSCMETQELQTTDKTDKKTISSSWHIMCLLIKYTLSRSYDLNDPTPQQIQVFNQIEKIFKMKVTTFTDLKQIAKLTATHLSRLDVDKNEQK